MWVRVQKNIMFNCLVFFNASFASPGFRQRRHVFVLCVHPVSHRCHSFASPPFHFPFWPSSSWTFSSFFAHPARRKRSRTKSRMRKNRWKTRRKKTPPPPPVWPPSFALCQFSSRDVLVNRSLVRPVQWGRRSWWQSGCSLDDLAGKGLPSLFAVCCQMESSLFSKSYIYLVFRELE